MAPMANHPTDDQRHGIDPESEFSDMSAQEFETFLADAIDDWVTLAATQRANVPSIARDLDILSSSAPSQRTRLVESRIPHGVQLSPNIRIHYVSRQQMCRPE